MNDVFKHLRAVRLLKGSHEFPGKAGGACINEVAVVYAGFEYRKVKSVNDMPACFSRPICAFALYLNDHLPNSVRTRLLLPYVQRLAGTADTPEIERRRAEYAAMRAVTVFVARALGAAGLVEHATECHNATNLKQAEAAATRAAEAAAAPQATVATARAATAAAVWAAAAEAATAAAVWAAAAEAATAAAEAATAEAEAAEAEAEAEAEAWAAEAWAAATPSQRRHIYRAAIKTLDGMLAIGRQAEAIDIADGAQRVVAALELA